MEIRTISLKDLNNLPKTAGVYVFFGKLKAKSSKPEAIYIGKAINIRDRVKNHFNHPSYRDNLFVKKVSRIGFIETNSEIDALVLEAQLIKKHLPKFNVVWRDDKNYFYVAVVPMAFPSRILDKVGKKNKNGLPYVYITHQPQKSLKIKNLKLKINYVGPFVEGNALKKTLKYLRRVFPFYTTARHPGRKCTWCHLGLCPGPTPDVIKYKKDIKKLILVLQGKRTRVVSSLRKEMSELSRAQKFEDAQKVRDQLMALERVLQHTHVIENSTISSDRLKSQNLLKELLGVKENIRRIECYDISNIQGKNATGAMVVFVDGAPDKSQYKKFKIRWGNESRSRQVGIRGSSIPVESGPDDIAMLGEVINRRLAHPEWTYPQVMLIDGGKAQLNVALKAKSYELQAKEIKVISIAKGRQELFIEGKKEPIPLKDLPQEVYNLVKHLDDEAHRFAISYHKKLHKKSIGLDKRR